MSTIQKQSAQSGPSARRLNYTFSKSYAVVLVLDQVSAAARRGYLALNHLIRQTTLTSTALQVCPLEVNEASSTSPYFSALPHISGFPKESDRGTSFFWDEEIRSLLSPLVTLCVLIRSLPASRPYAHSRSWLSCLFILRRSKRWRHARQPSGVDHTKGNKSVQY